MEFAKALVSMGVEIISTGGTYRLLNENGIKVIEVAEVGTYGGTWRQAVMTGTFNVSVDI